MQSGRQILQMRNPNGRTSHPSHHIGVKLSSLLGVLANGKSLNSNVCRDYGIGGPSMYRYLTLELVKEATAKKNT
jgi:hypothetical protein